MTESTQTGRERGILVIISSPSGAGKTTLARRLLAEFAGDMEFSVSFTTRPARPGERDGVDYRFVDGAEFDRMIAAGEFAEWAEVHGNRYGTSRAAVERALQHRRDVVFDVDWQGGAALSARWPDDALRIFILPPDLATLEDRLRRRASDSDEVIARRLRKAREELAHHVEYDHLVVNDELERAYSVLRAVYLLRRQAAGRLPESAVAEVPLLRALIEDNDRDQPHAHAVSLIDQAGR